MERHKLTQHLRQRNYLQECDEELPTEETIRKRVNELGYSLKKVTKVKPKKNSRNR